MVRYVIVEDQESAVIYKDGKYIYESLDDIPHEAVRDVFTALEIPHGYVFLEWDRVFHDDNFEHLIIEDNMPETQRLVNLMGMYFRGETEALLVVRN